MGDLEAFGEAPMVRGRGGKPVLIRAIAKEDRFRNQRLRAPPAGPLLVWRGGGGAARSDKMVRLGLRRQ